MITALSVLDVIVSIALIGSVLMQSGKGSGLSDAFGGGGGYFGKGNDMDTMMAKATIVPVSYTHLTLPTTIRV